MDGRGWPDVLDEMVGANPYLDAALETGLRLGGGGEAVRLSMAGEDIGKLPMVDLINVWVVKIDQ